MQESGQPQRLYLLEKRSDSELAAGTRPPPGARRVTFQSRPRARLLFVSFAARFAFASAGPRLTLAPLASRVLRVWWVTCVTFVPLAARLVLVPVATCVAFVSLAARLDVVAFAPRLAFISLAARLPLVSVATRLALVSLAARLAFGPVARVALFGAVRLPLVSGAARSSFVSLLARFGVALSRLGRVPGAARFAGFALPASATRGGLERLVPDAFELLLVAEFELFGVDCVGLARFAVARGGVVTAEVLTASFELLVGGLAAFARVLALVACFVAA